MRTTALILLSAIAVAAGDLSNRRAPGFSLPDADLAQHDLYDHRGQIVLLEIMKTECPTCTVVANTMKQLLAKYGRKVAVLSIALPPDNQTTVRAFMGRNMLTYPVLFDCGQVASSYLKVGPTNPKINLPHLFIIDREGMIREDWSSEAAARPLAELSAIIDKLIK